MMQAKAAAAGSLIDCIMRSSPISLRALAAVQFGMRAAVMRKNRPWVTGLIRFRSAATPW